MRKRIIRFLKILIVALLLFIILFYISGIIFKRVIFSNENRNTYIESGFHSFSPDASESNAGYYYSYHGLYIGKSKSAVLVFDYEVSSGKGILKIYHMDERESEPFIGLIEDKIKSIESSDKTLVEEIEFDTSFNYVIDFEKYQLKGDCISIIYWTDDAVYDGMITGTEKETVAYKYYKAFSDRFPNFSKAYFKILNIDISDFEDENEI